MSSVIFIKVLLAFPHDIPLSSRRHHARARADSVHNFRSLVRGALDLLHLSAVQDWDAVTACISGTGGFVVERTIMFSLRAAVAANPGTESEGLTEYLSVTWSIGFIIIFGDVCSILRCLLVNSTRPDESLPAYTAVGQLPMTPSAPKLSSLWSLFTSSTNTVTVTDDPKRRFRYRRMCDVLSLVILAGYITAMVGNARLIRQRDDATKTAENQALRYVSTALAGLAILWATVATLLWAKRLNRTHGRAFGYMILFCGLMAMPAIYRLSVMYKETAALDSMLPGSQNTPAEKGTFYLFHVLPEFVASFLLLAGINVRNMFNTGRWGDVSFGQKKEEVVEEKETQQ
ncbi:hypothetical protein BDZ89DRAFT_411009 [Hymenopellis radicata]|nr:hypothetical protein BDZ89DRAFT_411009 [Hymenopellis radicata]